MFRATLIGFFCLVIFHLAAEDNLVRTFLDPSGRLISEVKIPGIPPDKRDPGPIATPSRNAVMLNNVPAFDWCYGCTATSAAMLAGYYDRNLYPNMYAGPTNGGVCPLTNSVWGNGESPLSATHQGYDNLVTAGHVNRFWVSYGNSGNDPYGSANPTSTYANCTADYMGTNQDYWNNGDGSTTIFYYLEGAPLYDYSGSETANPRARDGIHGLKLFFASRGYSVTTNYNQLIQGYDGNSQGYSLASFRQSIDSGIPVFIHIQGHTMLGVGYESTNNTIYVHNTWDFQSHAMTWGGSYSGETHYAVSVIQLLPPLTIPQNPTVAQNLSSGAVTLSWSASQGSPTGYKIYFCPLPDFSSGVSLLVTVPSTQTSYTDANASSRPKGFYRVVSYRN